MYVGRKHTERKRQAIREGHARALGAKGGPAWTCGIGKLGEIRPCECRYVVRAFGRSRRTSAPRQRSCSTRLNGCFALSRFSVGLIIPLASFEWWVSTARPGRRRRVLFQGTMSLLDRLQIGRHQFGLTLQVSSVICRPFRGLAVARLPHRRVLHGVGVHDSRDCGLRTVLLRGIV